jgi:hypothetical protein
LGSADHNQRAEPVVLQPNVEVHAIYPHVHVFAPAKITPAKIAVFFLPATGQPRDVGRRQAGRVLAQKGSKGGVEIPGRKSAQVENRQHLGDLGRTAQVWRQNLAGEALAAALFIAPAVINPRRLHFYGSRSQGHFASGRVPVAHYQRVPLLVALGSMPLDVGVGLRLKCRHQHPSRTLSGDLVQRQKLIARFP